jgi:hypothetical protein
LARAFLEEGFYSLGTVKAAFLAFGTIAFGFFKGACHGMQTIEVGLS